MEDFFNASGDYLGLLDPEVDKEQFICFANLIIDKGLFSHRM